MNTYVTSDQHLDFDSILWMSGAHHLTVADYNQEVLDFVNRTVGEKDRLYILGDCARNGYESYLAAIRCKDVRLVIGNHDRSKAVKAFKYAEPVDEIKLLGHKCFMSHYPHCYWPSSHHGSLHLYGHCHDRREATMDQMMPGRRSTDVGLMTATRLLGEPRPFKDTELVDLLMSRPGHDLVEFYNEFDKKIHAERLEWIRQNHPEALEEALEYLSKWRGRGASDDD